MSGMHSMDMMYVFVYMVRICDTFDKVRLECKVWV